MLDLLIADFAAEAAALDGLLMNLSDREWLTPTPAAGWDIRDSVAHLAVGDDLALECVVEDRMPDGMAEGLEAVMNGADAIAVFEQRLLDRGRERTPSEVHTWWLDINAQLRAALAGVDPKHRLTWGPNMMSPASFVTARIMETWAHGLDCFDAAGVAPIDTDRLRHVALLAHRSLAYAITTHEQPAPGPVRFELTSPAGEAWTFGDDDAPTVIRATASDWCRVAVQRDRRDERSRVEATGPDAQAVLRYVQAYL